MCGFQQTNAAAIVAATSPEAAVVDICGDEAPEQSPDLDAESDVGSDTSELATTDSPWLVLRMRLSDVEEEKEETGSLAYSEEDLELASVLSSEFDYLDDLKDEESDDEDSDNDAKSYSPATGEGLRELFPSLSRPSLMRTKTPPRLPGDPPASKSPAAPRRAEVWASRIAEKAQEAVDAIPARALLAATAISVEARTRVLLKGFGC